MSPRHKENSERINVFLPPDILEKIKEIAQKKRSNVSAVIREILAEYLEK